MFRRSRPLALLLLPILGALVLTAPPADASEKRVGEIVSTNAASKNNLNTAGTFTIRPSGQTAPINVRVQCDVAAYVASFGCTDNTCAATNKDTQIAAGQEKEVTLINGETAIATLCVSAASCTCQVRIRIP